MPISQTIRFVQQPSDLARRSTRYNNLPTKNVAWRSLRRGLLRPDPEHLFRPPHIVGHVNLATLQARLASIDRRDGH
jgi:hypothetical protein